MFSFGIGQSHLRLPHRTNQDDGTDLIIRINKSIVSQWTCREEYEMSWQTLKSTSYFLVQIKKHMFS